MQTVTQRDEDGFRLRGLEVTRTEAFVDASFAFAMTLLVIFFNDLPDTVAELRHALLRVPTFVLCFTLLATFWLGHNRWSRRFGMEDAFTTVLSLAMVLVVLVFVYPLRMVISAFLATVSMGALPSELGLDHADPAFDMQTAFIVYSLGVGALSAILWILNRHAARHAHALELDARERHLLRGELGMHAIQSSIAVLSIATSLALLAIRPATPWPNSIPMWLYALNAIVLPLHWTRVMRTVPDVGTAHPVPDPMPEQPSTPALPAAADASPAPASAPSPDAAHPQGGSR